MNRIALLALVPLVLAACWPREPQPPAPGSATYADAMAREHAGETPEPNASAQEPAQEVVAEEVVYGTLNGQPLRGYLARPAAGGDSLPGLVVIHEWWGLNDNIRMMTRRLAGEGYTALAVDFYGGRVAASPDTARALVQAAMAGREGGVANLRAAAEYLRRERGAPRIGTIGWCFGGAWSLTAGLELPEQVDAVVMYYGQPVTEPERLRALDAPLLGLFGEADTGIPVAKVREMESALRTLGKEATIQIYPGAKHAFANPSGQAYDEAAAADAWQRTVAFLAAELKERR